MAKKNRNDYFQLMEQQTALCVEAAELLEQIIANYSEESLPEQRRKMHEIEHRADDVHHDILSKLSVEFITPIDQEDIVRLVQIMDDVTDALDEVVLEFYMLHIDTVPEDASALAEAVKNCVAALHEAFKELKNFKKPEQLLKHLMKVNTIETEADNIYVEAVHKLFGSEHDSRMLIGHRSIYESLENCCDLCENASEMIAQIIIKNT